MSSAPPAFSVVTPTYRRRASLERVLAGLARQEWPRDALEIVVVSDGGDDGSVEMARAFPIPFPLRVLEQANQGPAAARNLGVASASHPFVLFLDDDVVPPPRLVAEHARAHDGHRDRVVLGPLLEPPSHLQPWVRWEARRLAEQYRAMAAGEWAPTPWQLYTGNASILADHVRRAGGFDATYRRAEDVELGFRLERLGCTFVFTPEAGALHYAERSYASWTGAARQYGRNDILFGKGEERAAGQFRYRHPLTRALIRWGVRHHGAAARLPALASPAIRALDRLGLYPVADRVCGAVFNLEYWLGVCEEVGSPDAALDLIGLGSAQAP
jgi:GT2 family glycosyltransferase